MFHSFFTSRTTESPAAVEPPQERKTNRFFLRCQQHFAATLSTYDRRLSVVQRKFTFFLFCLILGGISTAWIVEGLFYPPRHHPDYLHRSTIVIPKSAKLPDSLDLKLLEQLRLFRLHHATDSSKP